MISASDALQRLQEGNRRFVSGVTSNDVTSIQKQRAQFVEGQKPFAVILGCSDSRVPAELVFDQGLGDLFVIRVAGNIVAPSQIGSIEFAVSMYGTQLVVVLGHSNCGAVIKTIQELKKPAANNSANQLSIVNRIRPTVLPLFEAGPPDEPQTLLEQAIRANIRYSVDQLRHGSQMLELLVNEGKLKIVGAEYSLATGAVDFFEGV